MIIKKLVDTNLLTGEETEREYCFHLSKPDMVRIIGRDKDGDWDAYIEKIAKSGSIDRNLDFVENVIKLSVGYRTPEGLFVKPKEFAEAFMTSEAYGDMFIELLTNSEEAEKFFKGIIGRKVDKSTNGIRHMASKRKHKKK